MTVEDCEACGTQTLAGGIDVPGRSVGSGTGHFGNGKRDEAAKE